MMLNFNLDQLPTRSFGNVMREVIVHYHIFKNAGTTFDSLLESNFGDAFCDHREDGSMRKGKAAYLEEYLSRNAHLSAISSHHMCYPLPEMKNVRFHPVIFLRHPIERAASVYHFEKKQEANTPGAIYAKEHDFKAYIEWRLDLNVAGVVRDYQTKTILGKTGRPRLELEKKDADLAISTLKEQYIFGVVENFDASLNKISKRLNGYFQDFNDSYQKKNVNEKNLKLPLSEKLTSISEELGSVYDRLVEANACDLKVWEFCHENTL